MFHTVLRERVPTSRRCVGGGAHGVQGRGHRRRRCGHRCGRRRRRPRTRPTTVVVYTEFEDVGYSPCGIPYVHGKEIPTFERLFLGDEAGVRRRRASTSTTTPSPRGSTPGGRSSTSRARARSPTTASSSPPASTTPTRVFPARASPASTTSRTSGGRCSGTRSSTVCGTPSSSRPARWAWRWSPRCRTAASRPTWSTPTRGLSVSWPTRTSSRRSRSPGRRWACSCTSTPRLEAFLGARAELRAVRTSGGEIACRPGGHLHAQGAQRPARRGRRARGRDRPAGSSWTSGWPPRRRGCLGGR